MVVLVAQSFALASDLAPTLTFFKPRGTGTDWVFWNANKNLASTFHELPESPRLVFWEPQRKAVLFVVRDTIYRADPSEAPAKPSRIANVPGQHGTIRALWRDRNSRRLRVIAMEKVEPANVLMEPAGPRYRLRDGTVIPGKAEPDWGTPFVCSVLELRDDGAWKLIAQRATKDEAGDTPGISVVDDLRNELGASNLRLLESYTCASGQCRNEVPAKLVSRAGAEAARTLTEDDVSLWKLGRGKPAILFGTVMGDQLHMTPPVLLISAQGAILARVAVNNRQQLGLGVDRDLLLVADEATGDKPLVIDLRTGKTRFTAPDGSSATWLPR